MFAAVLERNSADRDRCAVLIVSAFRCRRTCDGQDFGANCEIRLCRLVRVHRDAGGISSYVSRRCLALCIACITASFIFNRRRYQSGPRPFRRIGKACTRIGAAGIGRIGGTQGQRDLFVGQGAFSVRIITCRRNGRAAGRVTEAVLMIELGNKLYFLMTRNNLSCCVDRNNRSITCAFHRVPSLASNSVFHSAVNRTV